MSIKKIQKWKIIVDKPENIWYIIKKVTNIVIERNY